MRSRLPSDTTGKLTVRKEPLDSGGYTRSGGEYFGTPNNLWVVEGEEGYGHVRAPDLASAKKSAMREYPRADWGKRAVQKLVDDAARYLAKATRHVAELQHELDHGGQYPDQIRALLRHWLAEVPRAEEAVLRAQRVKQLQQRVLDERLI
jgi:hypothetical protein